MMSTAEVWASAAISKDPLMMQMFRDIHEHPELSADFHSLTAFNVFPTGCKSPLEVKSLAPHYRQASKSIVFSVLYGSGAQSLADGINSTLLEVWHERDHADPSKEPKWYTKQSAQDMLDDYFRKFPTLKRWIDKVHKQIKDYGFVYSPFGRKRRLPNHKSTDKGVVAECLRSGLNAVPQGASSDIMVQAAINMRKLIRINNWDIKIIALVHDSMVMEVREDLVDIAEKNAAACIQKDYGLFIEGAPMGYGIDSEDGGSQDYSCGKLAKSYPEVAEL